MTGGPMKARVRRERGAALLAAIVGIAVLTALAVDLAYQSRVSLRIAANARDQLRASYLARSGVAMSRLVLSFQQDLDKLSKVPQGAAPIQIPRVQIWRMVPVGSPLVEALFPGSAPAPGAGAGAQARFEAAIDDEGRKVNAQFEGYALGGDRKLRSKVLALYHLICDPKWDPLFEREDAHGVRVSREELLVHLRDWVDLDEHASGLVAATGGAHCAMVPDTWPFENAYSDENQPYDRGDDRYRAKNERMDSLDELYLVAGVGDAFMAAFGNALTVYLPRDAKRTLNNLDRQGLLQLVQDVAVEPVTPLLLEGPFLDQLQALVAQQTLGGILSITGKQHGDLIQYLGVSVDMNQLEKGPNSSYTDESTTFRIRSTGTAGDVTATIDAVVRLAEGQGGEAVAAPGRLIHWREE